MKLVKKIIQFPFLLLIHTYQMVVSPFLPKSCRYEPSCSEYSKEAIETHGIIKGIYLTLKRLLKCHPFGGSGYDPVPLTAKKKLKKHPQRSR